MIASVSDSTRLSYPLNQPANTRCLRIKIPLTLLALGYQAATASAFPLVEVTLYSTHNCSEAGTYQTTTLTGNGICEPLDFAAESVELLEALPEGCVLAGYNNDQCAGTYDIELTDGEVGVCYITGESMGTIAQAEALLLYCSSP